MTGAVREGEAAAVGAAVRRGADFLASRQGEDGSWRGDYGGPSFLLPMYVAAAYACRRLPGARTRDGMAAALLGAAGPEGGVGLHTGAREPMVFTTVLTYVALRLLGRAPDEAPLERMRGWIRGQGGPLRSAAWGKVVLAVLALYEWKGIAPLLPELYLLPYAAPFHPGRIWCHSRQVFLPMAYLYGTRARIPEDALVRALREELYAGPYGEADFAGHRHAAAACDRIQPPSAAARAAAAAALAYERVHPARRRRRALETVWEHVRYEDEATGYVRLGPVNAVLNTLVHHFRDPGGPGEARSWETLPGYLWEGGGGIHMNGYNSTALWDTAFAVKALLAAEEGGGGGGRGGALRRAYGYLREHQIREDPPERARFFRDPARGGWPFSDRGHGWPITDCTAEGLQCVLALEDRVDDPLPPERLRWAMDLILGWQNRDGGWATYERQRAGRWMELLNPSEFFRDIMVDASHAECTSACLQGLAAARARLPAHRAGEVARALARGARFLRRRQRPDGGWEGAWGVCFTYGTWFGVWGLLAAGAGGDDPAVARGCAFLLRHQGTDGGWGEDYHACLERRYVPAPGQPVQTAWALLALVRAGRGGGAAARRAAAFLAARQREDGDWAQDTLPGVFNRTTLIEYENYRRYFPLWALAEYARAGAAP